MRAETAAAGLDALRQMKLRGDVVAVILADYRMPELNGIEFLEQAMDIYPSARRVLLTAYADTGAAIDAINVVDLDHYLLKPWDPPEEKLYPVLDALLDAWQTSDHRPVPETKVVGHRWSARSSEVREFLARNQVPYRWYTSDEPEGQRLLAAAAADGLALPLVITPDGDPLIEPTDGELAARVGLATTPAKDFYDLIVIGGGPAGLGAAVYGASEGLRTVLVERTGDRRPGRAELADRELPGLPGRGVRGAADRPGAAAGHEVRRRGADHPGGGRARGPRFGAPGHVRGRDVHRRAHRHPGHRGVLPAAGRARAGRADRARGVLRVGADRGVGVRGQDVYVVGGANSAGQAAVYLSRYAKSVTILVRGSSLERSMSYYLIKQIADIANITRADLHRGRRGERRRTTSRR